MSGLSARLPGYQSHCLLFFIYFNNSESKTPIDAVDNMRNEIEFVDDEFKYTPIGIKLIFFHSNRQITTFNNLNRGKRRS
jgi:hypothetical protein